MGMRKSLLLQRYLRRQAEPIILRCNLPGPEPQILEISLRGTAQQPPGNTLASLAISLWRPDRQEIKFFPCDPADDISTVDRLPCTRDGD